jgi:hypothetical protein
LKNHQGAAPSLTSSAYKENYANDILRQCVQNNKKSTKKSMRHPPVTQSLEMLSGKQPPCFTYVSNVIDTGIGAIGGSLPDLKIPGISSGSNNFNAIGKSIQTKLANGTISGATAATAGKALLGANVAGAAGIVTGIGSSALGGGDAAATALTGRKSDSGCQ